MSKTSSYSLAGKLFKLLPIPYVLNVVLLLFWPLVGSLFMFGYWILLLVLSRQLSSLAASWKDTNMASSGIWILLSSISGLIATILGLAIPINAHLTEMSEMLATTTDPELALQLIAPYIVSIMVNAMIATPLQVLIPATCGLIGWNKLKVHVAQIADVQRYVVDEGIQKLLVAHKLQIAMGLLLAGTIASIGGSFAMIATGEGIYSIAILVVLIITLVLGIGVVITAIASFFTLLAGYSKTGDAFMLIKDNQGEFNGEQGNLGRDVPQTRCGGCGNSFLSQAGIKFCPICGAALP
jgi:hypothetical protein